MRWAGRLELLEPGTCSPGSVYLESECSEMVARVQFRPPGEHCLTAETSSLSWQNARDS